MADERVIEKIQKLLALAQSDNVNEAATAAAQAQRLMTKHQLEMADLEAATPGATDPIADEAIEQDKSFIPWKASLAAGVARANGCATYNQHLYDAKRQVAVVTRYVGPKSSLDTVAYMYRYLVREIDRLAAAARGPDVDRTWLRDFRLGAVAEVTTRLLKAAEAAKVGATGSVLAVVDRKAEGVRTAMASLGLKKGAAPTMSDQDAFQAGRIAGASVNISTGPALDSGAVGQLKP